MFNLVPGNYYDTIKAEIDRLDLVISRLNLDSKTLTFTDSGMLTIFCQTEQDALDLARSMIVSARTFTYAYMKYEEKD